MDVHLKPTEGMNEESKASRRLLNTKAVADYLSVHPRTILRYVQQGRLRAIRLSSLSLRFEPSDLENFISNLATVESDATR